jgi:hypothetical protein
MAYIALSSVQFLISGGIEPCKLFWCRALEGEIDGHRRKEVV